MSRFLVPLLACPVVLFLVSAADGGADAFPEKKETSHGGAKYSLVRTGVAVRYKGIFRVYVVASYVQEGAKVKDAAELLASNDVKELRLHFLVGVSGTEMAKAFQDVFRANHPAPQFNAEVNRLLELFKKTTAKRGDDVVLTHIPKVGLRCKRPGSEDVVIENVEFSRAIWENYLGKHNTGEDVKKGLVSELP